MNVVVEGYNKEDYITSFVTWETLCITECVTEAEDYLLKLPNNYVARIVEKEISETDVDNKHWEIYFGRL
jgi:hypothetical protein